VSDRRVPPAWLVGRLLLPVLPRVSGDCGVSDRGPWTPGDGDGSCAGLGPVRGEAELQDIALGDVRGAPGQFRQVPIDGKEATGQAVRLPT
jgi:hypothetical protein